MKDLSLGLPVFFVGGSILLALFVVDGISKIAEMNYLIRRGVEKVESQEVDVCAKRNFYFELYNSAISANNYSEARMFWDVTMKYSDLCPEKLPSNQNFNNSL